MKKKKDTWVYLMKDLRNGFIKIGESSNPIYREKTLQAEQPLIDLLVAWKGTAVDERLLHNRFRHKRLRGEWFSLSVFDIAEIYETFRDRVQHASGKSDAGWSRELALWWADNEPSFPREAMNADYLDFQTEGFGIEMNG